MSPESKSPDESAIRDVIDGFVRAVRVKDIDGMIGYCASDLATFDMWPPLKHQGLGVNRFGGGRRCWT